MNVWTKVLDRPAPVTPVICFIVNLKKSDSSPVLTWALSDPRKDSWGFKGFTYFPFISAVCVCVCVCVCVGAVFIHLSTDFLSLDYDAISASRRSISWDIPATDVSFGI